MGETNSELPQMAFSEHRVLWVSQREKLGAGNSLSSEAMERVRVGQRAEAAGHGFLLE